MPKGKMPSERNAHEDGINAHGVGKNAQYWSCWLKIENDNALFRGAIYKLWCHILGKIFNLLHTLNK